MEAATVSCISSLAFQTALTGHTVVTKGKESPAFNSIIANGGTLSGLTCSFSNGLPGRIDNTHATVHRGARTACILAAELSHSPPPHPP